MKFVAQKKGYLDDRLIQVGEEFEADKFDGSWAVPAKEYKPEDEKTEEQIQEEAREGLQGSKKKAKKKAKKKVSKKKVASKE